MKKLMIVAVAAAISAAASAASSSSLEAQAYDVSLTVKTTTCKEIKWTKAINTLMGASAADYKDNKKNTILVRKQATRKIAGVIWGCECDTIAYVAWRKYAQSNGSTVGGFLFWPVGGEGPFDIRTTQFGWAALNRIDNGEKLEGVWALVNDNAQEAVALLGAGFGKAKNLDCHSIVSSMSGSFAGFVLAGSVTDGCALCGSGSTPCDAWEFCPCTSISFDASRDLTAAYGTWKIKYNKSVSNSLRRTGRISQSFNFKKAKAGNAAELMAKVETVAAAGNLGSVEDLWDDGEGEGYTAWGEIITPAAVGAVAYAKTIKDGAVEEEAETEPELYSDGDEVSPLVAQLLTIFDEVETEDDES